MGFKDFRLNIIARVIGLAFSLFIWSLLLVQDGLLVTSLLVLGLVIFQVASLIRLMENTNREVINFLSSIRYDDFSTAYKLTGSGGTIDALNQEFNNVVKEFKQLRTEKEADYQYLKNIIHHVGIGILSFSKNGDVQIINAAAKRLLRVNRLRNIQKLESFSPDLVEQLTHLRTGHNALVRVRTEEAGVVQLAIYAIELYLRGEEFKLVTIQNINSELEEKEMEAWQNLIRVLTHEIMNSVAPVSSLAGVLEDELDYLKERGATNPNHPLQEEDFEDVQMAVKTIKRRTEALIHFVNDFRNLTNMPTPRLEHVTVKDIFDHISMLMTHEFQSSNIAFSTHLDPEALLITADREMIEQVLINLIKNAMQALELQVAEGKSYKSISLIGRQDGDNRPVITVKDNGPGIDSEALDRIFIPFFTTKKNGSGIGLSLSRQIMRLHKGTISARSKDGEGTEFDLKF